MEEAKEKKESKVDYEHCLDVPVVLPPSLLDFVEVEETVDEIDLWKKHWIGMPDFVNDKSEPYKVLKVNFRNEEDYQMFAKMVQQKLTEKTKSIWYPILHKEAASLIRWVEEGEE